MCGVTDLAYLHIHQLRGGYGKVHKVDCIDVSPSISCHGDIHDYTHDPTVPQMWAKYTMA